MRNTLIGFVVVTIAEVAGLVIWLRLTEAEWPWIGLVALVAGEAIEWSLLAYMIVNSPLSHPLKVGRVKTGLVQTALIALSESALWLTWLFLIPRVGLAYSTIAVAVAMHIKHDLDIAVFTGRSPFTLFDASDIAASTLEMGGAASWFVLTMSGHEILGAAVLLACITIEHILQFFTAGFFKLPKSS
jgi:hypothetical protein